MTEYRITRKHPQLGNVTLWFDVNRGKLQISRVATQDIGSGYTMTVRVRGGCWKLHLIERWHRGIHTPNIQLEELPVEIHDWLQATEDWLNSKECRDRIQQKLRAEINNLERGDECLKEWGKVKP